MILAMTTRATLGHTGRTLHADGRNLALYLMICLGAAARAGAALIPALSLPLLGSAGVLWLADRQSGVTGKGVYVRVDLGGRRRIIKNKPKPTTRHEPKTRNTRNKDSKQY